MHINEITPTLLVPLRVNFDLVYKLNQINFADGNALDAVQLCKYSLVALICDAGSITTRAWHLRANCRIRHEQNTNQQVEHAYAKTLALLAGLPLFLSFCSGLHGISRSTMAGHTHTCCVTDRRHRLHASGPNHAIPGPDLPLYMLSSQHISWQCASTP